MEKPAKKNLNPTSAEDAPSTKSEVNQGPSQIFPYSVTLMDASTTSVIKVISQITHEVQDLSTEDEELKYLTPAVKIVTLPTVVTPDAAIATEGTAITSTAPVPPPSFTSIISATPGALTPIALPPVPDTAFFQSIESTLSPTPLALPTPPPFTPVFSTNATTVDEDFHFIPSSADNNVNQFGIVPILDTVVTESDLETPAPSSTPTVVTDASGVLATIAVSLGDHDLEISVPGVVKKVGLGLNFTNMTASTSTGTSRLTLEPGLAEGAAAIDTPFLSFGSFTSVLLAVVIGFGLIMG